MNQKDLKDNLRKLENVIRPLQGDEFTDDDILALVNLILQGFIIGGDFTHEYRRLAAEAEEMRRQARNDYETLNNTIIVVDK